MTDGEQCTDWERRVREDPEACVAYVRPEHDDAGVASWLAVNPGWVLKVAPEMPLDPAPVILLRYRAPERLHAVIAKAAKYTGYPVPRPQASAIVEAVGSPRAGEFNRRIWDWLGPLIGAEYPTDYYKALPV